MEIALIIVTVILVLIIIALVWFIKGIVGGWMGR